METSELIALLSAGASLDGQALAGAQLEGVDFSGARLTRADLSRAKLKQARFTGADLHDANLSKCDARGADFSGTNLYGADLHRAKLSDCDFRGAKLSATKFEGANLSGANLEGVLFDKISLKSVDFSGANLRGARFFRCELRGTIWEGARFGNTRFPFYNEDDPHPGKPVSPQYCRFEDEFEFRCTQIREKDPNQYAAFETLRGLADSPRIIAAWRAGKLPALSAFRLLALQDRAALDALTSDESMKIADRRDLAAALTLPALDYLLSQRGVAHFGFGALVAGLISTVSVGYPLRMRELAGLVEPLVGELEDAELRGPAAVALSTLARTNSAAAEAVVAALKLELRERAASSEFPLKLFDALLAFGARAQPAAPLLESLASDDPREAVRQAATQVLEGLSADQGSPLPAELADLVRRDQLSENRTAHEQICCSCELELLPALADAFSSKLDTNAVWTLASLLGYLIRNTRAPEVIALLSKLLGRPKMPNAQREALFSSAGKAACPELAPLLRPYLDHRQFKTLAMNAVEGMRDEGSVDPLGALLLEPNLDRGLRVKALENIGSAKAIPHLFALLRLPLTSKKQDEELWPRFFAFDALGKLGDASTARELSAWLGEPSSSPMKAYAITPLCKLGAPESFEDVLRLTEAALESGQFFELDGGFFHYALEYFEGIGRSRDPRVNALAQKLAFLPNFAQLHPYERGVLRRLHHEHITLPE